MISHPDHRERSIREQRMNTVQELTQEEKNRAIARFIEEKSNPNSKFGIYRRIGRYHFIHKVNGDIDHEFNASIGYETDEEFNSTIESIAEKLKTGEISIEITKVTEDWDDIPSPDPQELAEAEASMNQFQIPLPPILKVPPTNEPSWD